MMIKEKDGWIQDEANFSYQTIEVGQEFTGKFAGIDLTPFTHAKFFVNGETVGIPLYYAIERFLKRYQVKPGLEMKLVNKEKKEMSNGKTVNVIDIAFKPDTAFFTIPVDDDDLADKPVKKKQKKEKPQDDETLGF